MKVLIAEDSTTSRHLLQAVVRKWGYEPVVACDGAQALERLREPSHPLLAILDWEMPGLTGPEVCRRLRQENSEPYVYVLLLTSKNLKADVIAGMEAGADDYVTKPFDQHELKVRLRAGRRIVELQDQLLAAREALREHATRDSLTGLWNRRSITEALEREAARAKREGSSLALLMADLDRFKQVNDSYGHVAGDIVLCEASRRMASSARVYDFVGRYGGEEFLVLLPGCGEEMATRYAERIRAAIAEAPIAIDGEVQLQITASFGVTASGGTNCGSPQALIQAADEALYAAKRGGRNKVVFVPVAVPQPQ